MTQYHFDPATYAANIRDDIVDFDVFQDAVADATRGVDAGEILELGTGTGETARRVLALHPRARLVGLDASEAMLAVARSELDGEFRVARLEDPLPPGPFDLVVSALAVHHLDAPAKQALFRRVYQTLHPGGRLVLGDVVVPERPADAVIPLSEGFDFPDRVEDQLRWLAAAGFVARAVWQRRDLAIVAADRPG